ncbi:MAG: guanylate kinase [Patescibacteria group bacterium]
MSNTQKGLLVLIVGPSGSGKGTVVSALKKRHPDYVFPVSATTRDPRPSEVDGQVYRFISKENFEQGIDAGDFLEWAEVHKNNYYGTPKQPILDALDAGKVVVREVDIQGFLSIRQVILREELVSIFLLVKDLNELKSRILRRGKMSDEEMARRMVSAEKEIAEAYKCNYRVESPQGQIPRIVEEVEGIIEKSRRV